MFKPGIRNKTIKTFKNPILCLESAMFQLGIGTYMDKTLHLLSEVNSAETFKTNIFEYHNNLLGYSNIINVDGIKCTSLGRTLAEMIVHDRYDEWIEQIIEELRSNSNHKKEINIFKSYSNVYSVYLKDRLYRTGIEDLLRVLKWNYIGGVAKNV